MNDIVENVLDLEAVEVFECHGALVYREPFEEAKILVINPVPVLGEGGDRIGFATVDVDNKHLDTKVFITKECPERLDIENGEPYFLSIFSANTTGRSDSDREFKLMTLEIVNIQLNNAKGGSNLPLVSKGSF